MKIFKELENVYPDRGWGQLLTYSQRPKADIYTERQAFRSRAELSSVV